MPAQTLDACLRALAKSEPAPAYYFHGPEDLLKDEALRAILDRSLDPSLRDFNLDQRSAGQLDADTLFGLCSSLPMMAERRVVVLREVEALKRKPKVRGALLEYLGRPAPDTVLVLIQGPNEESRTRTSPGPRSPWRASRCPRTGCSGGSTGAPRGLGVDLPEDAARHMVRAVGGELATLAAELEKLAALPAGEPLTVERVGELLGVRHGETLLDWRDAVLGDRSGPAVQTARATARPAGHLGREAGDDAGHDADRRRHRARALRPGTSRQGARRGGVRGHQALPGLRAVELGRGEESLASLGPEMARRTAWPRRSDPCSRPTARSRTPPSPMSGAF